MTVFAFIFARGGSVGLPGKNIRPLGGIPLLAHSTLMAKKIERVAKVFVSTDCPKIAAVAKEYGACIINRPAELASNTAPEWLAWRHAIEILQAQGEHFDVFLSLPPTSPLRIKEDVEACLDLLKSDTDAVITVTSSARSPYFNMITRSAEGMSQLLMQQGDFARRQEVPATFDITTVAYVLRPQFILEQTHLFSGRVKSLVIPKQRSVDIDDLQDFLLAETLYTQGVLCP